MSKSLSNFPNIYLDIMHDLMLHGGSTNAQTTIEGLKNLYFQRETISEIDSEQARNNEIFKVCHLEVDPGFCAKESREERLSEINEKLELLVNSYEDAKRNSYLEHYFLSGFESDAQFNHRLEHLNAFYNKRKHQVAAKG